MPVPRRVEADDRVAEHAAGSTYPLDAAVGAPNEETAMGWWMKTDLEVKGFAPRSLDQAPTWLQGVALVRLDSRRHLVLSFAEMKPSRREFLVAATALPIACKSAPPPAPPDPFPGLEYFVATEARIMDAWLEQLIPSGGGKPGARDARVLYYIDKQLTLPTFQAVARGVRRAGVILQRAATKQGVVHFADLDPASQRELLTRLQTNQLDGNTSKVFEVFLLLALEGYLGDPKYGGNKDGIVWAALGESPACPHK